MKGRDWCGVTVTPAAPRITARGRDHVIMARGRDQDRPTCGCRGAPGGPRAVGDPSPGAALSHPESDCDSDIKTPIEGWAIGRRQPGRRVAGPQARRLFGPRSGLGAPVRLRRTATRMSRGVLSCRVLARICCSGRVAQQSTRSAWYPKDLGSSSAFSIKHAQRLLHGC